MATEWKITNDENTTTFIKKLILGVKIEADVLRKKVLEAMEDDDSDADKLDVIKFITTTGANKRMIYLNEIFRTALNEYFSEYTDKNASEYYYLSDCKIKMFDKCKDVVELEGTYQLRSYYPWQENRR